MKKLYGIGLACAWLAVLAAVPFIYMERRTLEPPTIILISLVALLLGYGTVLTIMFLLDKK